MLNTDQTEILDKMTLKPKDAKVYARSFMSGYKQIDDSLTNKNGISAIRPSSTYLIAGLEKSGKTAFSLNLLSNLIAKQTFVGLISTEMSLEDVTDRLISIRGADKNRSTMVDLNIQMSTYLCFIGKGSPDLYIDNKLSLEACLKKIRKWQEKECIKVVFFDNITSFSSSADGNKKGWEIQAASMTKLGNLASELKIVLFLVIHTKNTSLAIDTKRIESIVKSDDPGQIFKSEVTVVRRPSLADCYGGGAAQSQIMGAFLIWRPFQKFSDPKYKSQTALILESMRYADSGKLIEFDFNLETGKWTEIEPEVNHFEQDKVINSQSTKSVKEISPVDQEWEKTAISIFEN